MWRQDRDILISRKTRGYRIQGSIKPLSTICNISAIAALKFAVRCLSLLPTLIMSSMAMQQAGGVKYW